MQTKEEATAPPSLPEQAYHQIRRLILDLGLLPGEKLILRDLAERLQMSRTPVREALVRLSAEGLVENVPNRGMRVAVPTAEATREIYEIVEAIEGQAAKLAAQRGEASAAGRLEAAVEALEDAVARGDLHAWAEGDRVFHDLLVEASGNRRMRDLLRTYDGHFQRIRTATVLQRRAPDQSVRDHRALVEAIRAGDGERARAIHFAHRDQALAEHERIVADMMALVFRPGNGTASR